MQVEIEAKFLNVNHDEIRAKLKVLGAVCEKPLRQMVRTVFDFPDGRIERVHSRLRVRDEGDKITITYKSKNAQSDYADETETTVGSYDEMVKILEAIGLQAKAVQETRRETWRYGDVEIMLDEWPWLKPFVEIEGKSEADVQECARLLGFGWATAKFGAVETVCRAEFPGIGSDEKLTGIGDMRFGAPVPEWLEERRQPK